MAGNTLAVDIVAKTDGLTAGLARATGQLDAFSASVNKASTAQAAASGEQSLQAQAMTTAQVWVASRRAIIDAETHANTVLKAGRKADAASLGDALATMEQRRDAYLAATRAYYDSLGAQQQTAFAAQEAAANKEIEAEYQRLAARLDDATAIQAETAALEENTAATVVNGSTAREATYMIDEIASGRFRRLGGSSVVLANRMGLLSKLFTPLGLSISGTAVAVGVLGAAMIEGERQADALDRAILSTNDSMGITQGRFESMASAIAGGDITIGAARSALLTLAQSGRFTGSTLQEAATAAVDFADLTDSSMKQAASAVEQLAQRPLEAIVKLNDQYHFLTAAEYQQIAALSQAGNASAAAKTAIDAFGTAMHARAEQSMRDEGYIVRAFENIKDAAVYTWSALESVGSPETYTQKLADLKAKLAEVQGGGNFTSAAGYSAQSAAQAAQIEGQIRALQLAHQRNVAAAEEKAEQDQINAAGVRAAAYLDKQVAGLKSVNVELAHEQQITAAIEALHRSDPTSKLLQGDQFNAQGHLTKGNATYDQLIANIQRKFDSHPVQIRFASPSASSESTSGIEQMLTADRNALSQMTAASRDQAATANSIDQMRVSAAENALNAAVSAHAMSAAQRLAIERSLTGALYAEDLKRLEDELASLTPGTAAYQQAYDQILQMKEREVVRLDNLEIQTSAATQKSAARQASAWSAMTATILRSEGNLVQNIISGRRTLSQSVLAIGQEMVGQEIQNDMKLLTMKLLMGKQSAAAEQSLESQSVMFQLAADAEKLMSTVKVEAAKTGATIAGETARKAAKVAGQAAGKAIDIAGNEGQIASAAATAAAGAYKALAGIPVVGPVLGAAAAGVTYAAVIAYKNMASYDVGAWNIPSDHTAMVHAGELIMPRPYADDYRAAMSRGVTPTIGGGPSSADLMEAVRRLGGGDGPSSGELHLHVHAMDGESVQRLFENNGDHIATGLHRAIRGGWSPP